MNEYYFTFGHGHHDFKHPSLLRYYTIVFAETEHQAREMMRTRRGDKYSSSYCNKHDAGVDRFELEYIPFDELTPQPKPIGGVEF